MTKVDSGTWTLNGTNTYTGATAVNAGNNWLLYDVAGATTGFSSLSIASANWADGSGNTFKTVRGTSAFSLSQTGSDIFLNFTVNAVPAPSSLLVLGVASVCGVVARRRKRKSKLVSIER